VMYGELTGTETDKDGDGSTVDVDCDDTDPNTFPGAPEICDGVVNTCVSTDVPDEGFPDTDLDGMKDCVDPEIDQFLIVEYVSTPGEEMVCEQLNAALSYGTAHMVLEAIAVQ
jgi:hypothetical protein